MSFPRKRESRSSLGFGGPSFRVGSFFHRPATIIIDIGTNEAFIVSNNGTQYLRTVGGWSIPVGKFDIYDPRMCDPRKGPQYLMYAVGERPVSNIDTKTLVVYSSDLLVVYGMRFQRDLIQRLQSDVILLLVPSIYGPTKSKIEAFLECKYPDSDCVLATFQRNHKNVQMLYKCLQEFGRWEDWQFAGCSSTIAPKIYESFKGKPYYKKMFLLMDRCEHIDHYVTVNLDMAWWLTFTNGSEEFDDLIEFVQNYSFQDEDDSRQSVKPPLWRRARSLWRRIRSSDRRRLPEGGYLTYDSLAKVLEQERKKWLATSYAEWREMNATLEDPHYYELQFGQDMIGVEVGVLEDEPGIVKPFVAIRGNRRHRFESFTTNWTVHADGRIDPPSA
jgi:hypothetical protein